VVATKETQKKWLKKFLKTGGNINMIINQGEKIKEDVLRAMAGWMTAILFAVVMFITSTLSTN